MTPAEIFTKIDQRGAQLKLTRRDIDPNTLAAHLTDLRDAGHAVVADETFDHQGVSLGLTVIHYLTCKKCKGD